jgi:flavin-dependent dehydrogenase
MTRVGGGKHIDVAIVGGGLAGASCAIELARAGFEVALFEKKGYPRHKMCGEFLSAEARPLLRRLGVGDELESAGAAKITFLRLTERGGTECRTALPNPAIGISRYALDALLMNRARAAGVLVHEGCAVTRIDGSLRDGFGVETLGDDTQADTRSDTWRARVVIGAWGRRSRLDRSVRGDVAADSPWVAFKAHFEGEMPGVVELHAFADGYCGVAPIEGGTVNACWIMHRDRIPDQGADRFQVMLSGVLPENPLLADRLSSLRSLWDKPVSASQLSFLSTSPFASDVCLVGDAAGMIAPLCGDGMSMALTSGIFAAAEAGPFLRSETTAAEFTARYTRAWRRAFSRRMILGRISHAALSNPRRARAVVALGRRAPGVIRAVVGLTRGA